MHGAPVTVTLGKGGPRLLPLGLGTWQWGDRTVWGYGRRYGRDDVREALWTSVAAGVSLIDTAEIYGRGRSERLIGQFLRSIRAPVLVATKFFPFPWRLREADFLRALEGSLERLGRDHIDLYQVHWPTPFVPVERLMAWMANAVERGLVTHVGVSNFGLEATRRAHAALARRGLQLASNQLPFHLLQRTAERSGLLSLCRELGVAVIAYSPIAQGALSGKYSLARRPPGVRGVTLLPSLARIEPLLGELRRIADHHRRTPAQVALRWTIEKGAIPIPGAKNAQQAAENVGALQFALAPEDVAALDRAADLVDRVRFSGIGRWRRGPGGAGAGDGRSPRSPE
jgi:aryl-alcohol dehydrogenase-like predicted oxidoreductase